MIWLFAFTYVSVSKVKILFTFLVLFLILLINLTDFGVVTNSTSPLLIQYVFLPSNLLKLVSLILVSKYSKTKTPLLYTSTLFLLFSNTLIIAVLVLLI